MRGLGCLHVEFLGCAVEASAGAVLKVESMAKDAVVALTHMESL